MGDRLNNKVAIITGGASGMGLGTVRRFVEEGARVVIADVQDEGGDAIVSEMGDQVRYKRTDVSKEHEVSDVVDFTVSEFGRLDCMFNNAGFGGVSGELDTLDLGDFYRYTIDVLFTGVLSGIKHAGRVMKAQGDGGSIINTASVAGLRGGWGLAAQAEGGLQQRVRVVRIEVRLCSSQIVICEWWVSAAEETTYRLNSRSK